jgi:hypothetical protein
MPVPAAARPQVTTVSARARYSLFVAALLIVWGPPALRSAGRELDAALADPLRFDAAALLQVGAWIFADALALFLVLAHLARGTPFLSALLADRPVRWYGLFGVLGLASVTYSSAPVYTAFFAHKILVGILVLALLEWHWPSRRTPRALQVLFTVYSLQAAAIAVLYFVDREWVTPFGAADGSERVRITGGVFSDYGSSALLSGLFFLTVVLFGRKPEHRLVAGAAYIGTWALLILSQTRSSMGAGIAFLAIMLHAHRRARVQGALVVAGVSLAIVGLLPVVTQSIISTGTREGQGLDTLSGRTVAFSYLVEQWKNAPLIGHGFAAGTRNALLEFVVREGINIGAGHDALSTVLVDLGLIGLLFLLVAFVSAWTAVGRLFRARASDQAALVGVHQVACLMVWVTIQTFVSTSLSGPYLVFIVAIVAAWTLRTRGGPAPAVAPRRQASRLGG